MQKRCKSFLLAVLWIKCTNMALACVSEMQFSCVINVLKNQGNSSCDENAEVVILQSFADEV